MAEKLGVPKSVAQQANIIARRVLSCKDECGATIPAISAFALLYACRSAGISRISHREIIATYSQAGHRVGKSQLLQIGLGSATPLPQANVEELQRASLSKLQVNESVSARMRKANLDERAYFIGLFEQAKVLADVLEGTGGFNPRTMAAGSLYLASVTMQTKKTFTQREVAESLGIAEYTVREFVNRTRSETILSAGPLPVKSGTSIRGA
jgi:transcription initiation factor TFIIIB Brf1 subunit/transcription initiation factor TFIIB